MASSSEKSAAGANKILGKREPGDDFENKPILKKHKEESKEKETTEGFADIVQQIKRRVELLETKSDQASLFSVKEVSARKRTLYVSNLSSETKISDITDLFQKVGEVVRVQLVVNRRCNPLLGLVEFASANEAKKALEKKNGECLCGHHIILGVANERPDLPRLPKFYVDQKVVWYKDYLRRESLLIEENETMGGYDEDTDSVEEVALRKKTLFVADLSPQTEILDVCKFFCNVGEVVSVRLVVNHEGKHVGCGFVEFDSANEAMALEKNGEYLHDHKIFLDVAKIYPPRPMYNLEEDETVESLDKDPDFVEKVAGMKKTFYLGNLSRRTELLDICKFFHSVGEVVHVRLNINHKGRRAGAGFIEFASANEAMKALEEKKGGHLHHREVTLDLAKGAKYLPPTYFTDHKVWYEDHLRRESLLTEEDETVEGLVEEVVVRNKTLFVANLPPETEMVHIYHFFLGSGKAVSTRLVVNDEGKHVGCAFVEFASVDEANKALKEKNGRYFRDHEILLDVAKVAAYPPRPKYNLVEKLWYEDYLRRYKMIWRPNRPKR